jgi:hypothetical protein
MYLNDSLQPYVPYYDSIADCRVASWIEETICIRNTVTVLPAGHHEEQMFIVPDFSLLCAATSSARPLLTSLDFYKNNEALFWKGNMINLIVNYLNRMIQEWLKHLKQTLEVSFKLGELYLMQTVVILVCFHSMRFSYSHILIFD